jgi:hypothetical protein
VRLPSWALPASPIVAAGIALAALIITATKSTDWAVAGYVAAAAVLSAAAVGVRLVYNAYTERRKRTRRARTIIAGLIAEGKTLQHQPGYQTATAGCEMFAVSAPLPPLSTTTLYTSPLSDLLAKIETWRTTVKLKLCAQPFKKGTDTYVLEAGGNRLDPVLDRLRDVLAHIDDWVDHDE